MEAWAAFDGETLCDVFYLLENLVAATRQHVLQDSRDWLQVLIDCIDNVRLGKSFLMLQLDWS